MIDSAVGLLIIVSITVLSSVIWHYFLKVFKTALIGSTITTVLLIQIISYIELGYLDSFFIIAMFTTSVMALIVSSIVGLLFERYRKQYEI